MLNKNRFLKIIIFYFYMYFVGPLIWGFWMIKRLRIITLQEYMHCLISPISLGLFVSFFLLNILHTGYVIERHSNASESRSSILKVHCISIITFGIIGTPLFLSGLSANHYSQGNVSVEDWFLKVVIGSMSGIALIFMFYVMFSVSIIGNLKSFFLAEDFKEMYKKLKRFNTFVYVIGLFFFFASSTLA